MTALQPRSHSRSRSPCRWRLLSRNAKIAAIQAQLVEIRVCRAHQTANAHPHPPTPTRFPLRQFPEGVQKECSEKKSTDIHELPPRLDAVCAPCKLMRNARKENGKVSLVN